MPRVDRYGNAITTESDQARDRYDHGVSLFLAASYGALDAFTEATAADPRFALGHVGVARAAIMSGQMDLAKSSVAKAIDLAPAATERERAHIAVVGALLSGNAVEARRKVRAHVLDFPRDAMCAQLCASVFGLIGFSGEAGREAQLLAYTSYLLPHYGKDWWAMSMHAISLCETGQIGASQDLMAASLALNPRNANAAHFKAHAHYEAGEVDEGRAYLSAWIADYDDRAALHGHLSWHAALWALHTGDTEEMWHWVDKGVAPGAAKGLPINILTDTSALLYRAEMAGIDVAPDRWARLSDYAAQFFPETGQSFVDIHAALAHAMAGQGERLARIAEGACGFAGDLAAPVAKAWGAMARGSWSDALADLTPVMAQTERLGGSRAQRDLLELAWVHTLMKLGRNDEAKRMLATRRPVLTKACPLQNLP